MLFTGLLALSASVGSAAAAALTPPSAPSPLAAVERSVQGADKASAPSLEKRGPESLHLVNCNVGNKFYSIIVYCADDSNCAYQPAPQNFCYVSNNGFTTWEGRSGVGCTFSTGVNVRFTLPNDAKKRPLYTAVGSASNGYREFTLFNDNGPVMYTGSDGSLCRSIYYGL